MKTMNRLVITGITLGAMALGSQARADDACWRPDELKAYDITMQTLMIAHVAASCDALSHPTPPLAQQVSAFLGKHGKEMQADRGHLADLYRRAYGADWEGPMQASLAREDKRITAQVSKATTPDSCAGAAQLVGSMANASWPDFVKDAEAQNWHERAGFPACE